MTRDLSVREELPAQNEAIRLYDSVGWSAYTRDPALLMASLTGSHRVYTARTGSDELVGLARTISTARRSATSRTSSCSRATRTEASAAR